MKKIALIDGYGFVFRAYHSLPPLTRSDGTPVGAVYGFTNMLIKLLAGLDVSHAAVIFDSGSKTFRNEIYPQYKANRPPCPEDLKPQFPIIRKTAESLNLSIVEKIGFEADDIIATIAKKSANEGYQVLIVSSDKDLMQLVSNNILMFDAMKNKMIGENEVQEKFSVAPNQVLDLLSLVGDSSDNIPGVKGIGPKTAAELLQNFGSLEGIFENLSNIKQERKRQLLLEGIEKAKLSKSLVTLKHNVELGIELDDLKIKALDPIKLIVFLEEQGFRSLIAKVRKEFGIEEKDLINIKIKNGNELPDDLKKKDNNEQQNRNKFPNAKQPNIKSTEINSLKIIKELHQEAKRNGIIVIDYFTQNHQLDFITFSTYKADERNVNSPQEIFYLQLKNHKRENSNQVLDLFNSNNKDQHIKQDQSLSLKNFLPIFYDSSIKKIFFDAKNFLRLIENFREENVSFFKSSLRPSSNLTNSNFSSVIDEEELHFGDQKILKLAIDDVSLINHLMNSSINNNLRELIDANLDINLEELGFGKILEDLEKEKLGEEVQNMLSNQDKKTEFFCLKNLAISELHKIFYHKIFELKLNDAYFSYELPLLKALAKIEHNGIKIDVIKLNSLSQEFGKKIADLTNEIFVIAGCEFNIASSQQLSEVLFTKLGLHSSKKSKKTGALSTKAEVLEELAAEGNEIAEKILEFRKFSKLKNTYTDALPKQINNKTLRVHSSFSNTSTLTGRLNSSNPNLQNIPIKSIEGQKIRECFIAEKNNFLISADYSQIELRVIAHVAQIKNLVTAFKENKDIHRITASEIFQVPENIVDEKLRSKAKAINFGIIYKISAYGLARQLNISNSEAKDYIESYLKTYPGIEEYMTKCVNFARQNGFVKSISGRKCFIREINNKNLAIRQEAERQAINAPIQGSAADIIKKAMIRISERLEKEKLNSKLVLQIHDELIIESPENEIEIASKILREEMEGALVIDAPLKVEIKIGKSWQ